MPKQAENPPGGKKEEAPHLSCPRSDEGTFLASRLVLRSVLSKKKRYSVQNTKKSGKHALMDERVGSQVFLRKSRHMTLQCAVYYGRIT